MMIPPDLMTAFEEMEGDMAEPIVQTQTVAKYAGIAASLALMPTQLIPLTKEIAALGVPVVLALIVAFVTLALPAIVGGIGLQLQRAPGDKKVIQEMLDR